MMRATLLLGLICIASVAPAETQPSPFRATANADAAGSTVPRFQRVFAPADRLPDWPFDRHRYLPLEPDEFERLVKSAEDAARGATPDRPTRLTAARYDVRLQSEQSLAGAATFSIAHRAEAESLLVLHPFRPAIHQARWLTPEERPAVVGIKADRRLAVVVDQAGELRMDWSLRGAVDTDGSRRFDLQLPRCSRSQMNLDLPAAMDVTVDRGVVLPVGSSAVDRRSWRVELAGGGSVMLRVSPRPTATAPRPLALVRQHATYQFWPHGVDFSVGIELDARSQPLRQLQFALDPGCRVVAAQMGTSPLEWKHHSTAPAGEANLTLFFPQGIQGPGHSLRLAVVSPLRLNERRRLPTLRPLDAEWETGDMTVLIPDSLSLNALRADECRQIRAGSLGAPVVGESHTFQCFSPAAALEVLVAPRETKWNARCGTTVAWGDTITAHVVADLEVAEGQQFSLPATLAPGWIIDSVESSPPDMLADWTVEANATGDRQLSVLLAKPLTPVRPVRLVVLGRRSELVSPTAMPIRQLVPLEFQQATAGRNLLVLRPSAGSVLDLRSSAEAIVDRQTLDTQDAALFDGTNAGVWFDVDSTSPTDEVALIASQPTMHATIDLDVEVRPASVQETVTIRCVPDNSPLRRVVVRFSQQRQQPLSWTSVTDGVEPLEARRLSADELAAAGFNDDDETWEISLGRARGGPIEISATRSIPTALYGPVSLVSLPHATRQQATVRVRAPEGTPLAIDAEGPTPIPLKAPREEEFDGTAAAYRYQEAHAQRRTDPPALRLSVVSDDVTASSAIVWDAVLSSSYDRDGLANHVMRFRLENSGLESVLITLPDQPQEVQFVVDGKLVNGLSRGTARQVKLPAGRRFVTIDVSFLTRQPSFNSWQLLPARMPRIDLPIVASRWQVSLPPDWEMLKATGPWSSRGGKTWSLSQRLFGPLGRPESQPPFDPTSRADWTRASGVWHRRAADAMARKILHRFGQRITATPSSEATELDWRGLAGESTSDRESAAPSLLIDTGALAALGIGPRTPIARRESTDLVTAGATLLNQFGLALLVTDGIGVITSRQAIAADSVDWLPGLPAARLARDSSTPTDGEISIGTGNVMPVTLWAGDEAPSRENVTIPWQPAHTDGRTVSDAPGQTAHQLVGPADLLPTITVVDRGFWQVGGCAALLIALLICWSITTYWRSFSLPLAAAAGLSALWAPGPWVPVAAGAFWGTLVCVGLRAKQSADRFACLEPLVPSADSTTTTTAAVLRSWLVVAALFATWFAAATSAAQDEDFEQPTALETTDLYRVFIPIDDERQPTDEPYQVPEPLLRSLRRLAADGRQEPRSWIVRSAVYRAQLEKLPDEDTSGDVHLEADLDVSVFQPGQIVTIPLARQHLSTQPGAIHWGGQALDAQWHDGQVGFSFAVADPGNYRLRLRLRGVLSTDGDSQNIDFAAIPAAQARVIVDLPPGATDMEIASARGAVGREIGRRRLTAELGASDVVTLRWPVANTTPRVERPMEVDELLWLRILPGSVGLDARFTFSNVDRAVNRLRIAADPRLRLKPRTEENPRIKTVQWISDAQFTGLEVELNPRGADEPLVVETSLQLAETPGVGRLRLPRLEPLNTISSRRWWAVSIDPALKISDPEDATWQGVNVADFMSNWGGTEQRPDHAFEIDRGPISGALAVRPRPPQTACRQLLAFGAGPDGHEVRWRASVSTSAGSRFSHRISAPPELRVRRVAVLQDDAQRANRWTRDETGAVTIFLNGPTTGEHRIELDGWLPQASAGEVIVPRMHLETAVTSSQVVEVYRRPGVVVDVVGSDPDAVRPDNNQQNSDLGRLVDTFDLTLRDDPVILQIRPNRPETRGVETLLVRRDGADWYVDLDYQLRVSGGVVDRLWLMLPPELTVLAADPPLPYTLANVGDQGRQRLVIRPPEPIDGDFRLVVRARQSPSADDELQLPQVDSASFERTDRIVILPVQFDLSFALWATTGLAPIPLPADLSTDPGAEASFQAYRAVQPRFGVVLRSMERFTGAPRVRLADFKIAWTADHNYHGLASFDIEPAGMSHGVLQFPVGCRPIMVAVERLPTTAVRQHDRQYLVRFNSDQLPQRVDLLFAGGLDSVPSDQAHTELAVPNFDRLPVLESLWTIARSDNVPIAAVEAAHVATAAEQQLSRLESVEAMIQSAARSASRTNGVIAGAAVEDIMRWYPAWARRGRAEHAALISSAYRLGNSPKSEALKTRADTLLQAQQQAAREMLGSLDLWTQVQLATPRAIPATNLWTHAHQNSRNVVMGRLDGRVESLAVQTSVAAAHGYRRWMLALVLVSLAVVGASPLATTWAAAAGRWPAAVGVGVGIAWWLWFVPSAIGLLIIAVSLILPAWPLARKHAIRDPGSSVIRIASRDS